MNQREDIDKIFENIDFSKLSQEEKEEILKNDEVYQAHIEIVNLQKNEVQPLRTGIDHTDEKLIDGLSNKMIFYGSRPSMGKTYLCDEIIENLTDKKVNPMDVEILRLNWEMASKMLLLRKLKIDLGKSMREIVTNPYTPEEQEIVKRVVSKLRHPSVKNYSKIVEGEFLKYLVRKFVLSGNPDAEKVVLVDHLHILTKKERIDNFLSICNELKLEFPNLSFIFFFQLNRELEKIWKGTRDAKPNPKNFRPHSGHIYNTDNLMQYADLICTLIIPQVVNLDEYASVYREYYQHLSEHFMDNDLDNSWVRLKGKNRIYYEYIKNRLVDDFDEVKLFCRVLDKSKEEEQRSVPPKQEMSFKAPVFENPNEGITPITDMSLAFGDPFEGSNDGDDNMPF